MKTIHLKVVSKSPPGGRCEIYDRFFFEIVKGFKNVYYTLIPSDLFEREVTPPAVFVNDRLLEPEDGILLTPQEILKALREEGAVEREGSEVEDKLNSIYNSFIENL